MSLASQLWKLFKKFLSLLVYHNLQLFYLEFFITLSCSYEPDFWSFLSIKWAIYFFKNTYFFIVLSEFSLFIKNHTFFCKCLLFLWKFWVNLQRPSYEGIRYQIHVTKHTTHMTACAKQHPPSPSFSPLAQGFGFLMIRL